MRKGFGSTSTAFHLQLGQLGLLYSDKLMKNSFDHYYQYCHAKGLCYLRQLDPSASRANWGRERLRKGFCIYRRKSFAENCITHTQTCCSPASSATENSGYKSKFRASTHISGLYPIRSVIWMVPVTLTSLKRRKATKSSEMKKWLNLKAREMSNNELGAYNCGTLFRSGEFNCWKIFPSWRLGKRGRQYCDVDILTLVLDVQKLHVIQDSWGINCVSNLEGDDLLCPKLQHWVEICAILSIYK